ncbi:MAG: hypothetical protein GC179_04390 [Anaerolineaceae bacterium]|nr:hypothetical protein [Anaerolineaceae bacterium]
MSRERVVFDSTLRSRLGALGQNDAVVFICDSQATIDSLQPFEAEFPQVLMTAIITNPRPFKGKVGSTPFDLQWETPDQWEQMQTTDRWTRIDTALQIGSGISQSGYLLMPAHDAVWGKTLLSQLEHYSHHYAKNNLPAAVSPYTYYQHSAVEGANIPADVIHLMNTALSRDTWFRWKIRRDRVQAFWGKMSMTPFGMCGAIRASSEQTLWEDDLDIDRIIRELNFGVRCLWVDDPQIYRQAPPVFDRAGVRKVIERTLHYSLHIPDERVGGSSLNVPLDWLGRLRQMISPRFRGYNSDAEKLIAECANEIGKRLENYGASWVDWGRYRYVARVRDPVVEIWRRKVESEDLI